MSETQNLDEQIDELAIEVEQTIQRGEEVLDSLSDYNPAHRRMEEADVTELFDG